MSSSKGIELISRKKRKCKENVKLATSTNGISTSRFFDMEEQNVSTWMCTTHRQRRLPKSHCSRDTLTIAALLLEILKISSPRFSCSCPAKRTGESHQISDVELPHALEPEEEKCISVFVVSNGVDILERIKRLSIAITDAAVHIHLYKQKWALFMPHNKTCEMYMLVDRECFSKLARLSNATRFMRTFALLLKIVIVSVTSSRGRVLPWKRTAWLDPKYITQPPTWYYHDVCFSRPSRQSQPVSTGEPTPSRSLYVTLKFKLFCSLSWKKDEEATTHPMNRPPSWSDVQQRSRVHWSLLERRLGTGPRGTGADLAAKNERVE